MGCGLDEKFEIERILDKKMVAWQVGKVRRRPPQPMAHHQPPLHSPPLPELAPHLHSRTYLAPQAKKGKAPTMKDYICYLVLWKGWPPETATWQYPVQRGITGGIPLAAVDEYEASLEAEAQLEAEEEAEDAEDAEEEEEE